MRSVLALLRRLHSRLRGSLRHRQRDLAVVRRAGAAGQQHSEREQRCRAPGSPLSVLQPCPLCSQLVQSTNSICSGASAAMIGPPRCSIQPRTRMRRPSSFFGSMPAAAKARCMAPQNDHGEIPRPAPPEIHIYSGPAFAHRQDLAFHQREPAALGLQPGKVFGRQRGEIWIGPKPAAEPPAPRVPRSKGHRRRLCRRRAPTPAPGLAPAWPAAPIARRRRMKAKATRRP